MLISPDVESTLFLTLFFVKKKFCEEESVVKAFLKIAAS